MRQLIGLFAFVVIVTVGCDDACAGNCQEINEAATKESRNLAAFTSIDIDSGIEVVIEFGDAHRIDLEAPADLLPLLRTRVSEGALVIDTSSCVNLRGKHRVRAKITTPALTGLRIDGSGDVSATSEVKTDRFDLTIGGSGDVKLGIAVKELTIDVSGSGAVAMKGKAGTIGVDVSGSGDIDLGGVSARRARVRVVGSGDVDIRATDQLDAQLTGSGDIRYIGTPKKLQKNVTGSGSIRPAS